MPFLDDIASFATRYRGYFVGKAALMLVAGLASHFLSISIFWPAAIIVGGGMALHAYGRFSQQRYYEQDMVNLYRDDIAQHLGIAPELVTRANLKEAAQGNEVIAQALERQHKKTVVDIGTTLLAGATTFGLLMTFGSTGDFFSFTHRIFGDFLGPLVNLIGLGTVGAFSGLVLHDGLSLAIGAKTGTLKAAAHDLIVAMDHDVAHGRPISREQIYGVLVAGNSALQERILTRFHKSYAWMNPAEKSHVLHEFGVASALDMLAQQINGGEIRPGRLAYLMDDDSLPALRARHARTHALEPAQQQSNFVARLGLAERTSDSFVAKVSAAREPQPQLAGAPNGRG